MCSSVTAKLLRIDVLIVFYVLSRFVFACCSVYHLFSRKLFIFIVSYKLQIVSTAVISDSDFRECGFTDAINPSELFQICQ